MSRFDYVKYDEQSQKASGAFKGAFEVIASSIEKGIDCPRSKALALTKLEESFAWIGKGIRNDQIERNGKCELQEERCNSREEIERKKTLRYRKEKV